MPKVLFEGGPHDGRTFDLLGTPECVNVVVPGHWNGAYRFHKRDSQLLYSWGPPKKRLANVTETSKSEE